MPFLVVVKREEADLYDYLRRHFEEPDVTVVLDRRQGERRRAAQAVAVDRRRGERRVLPADDDPLWRYGFRVAIAQSGSERSNR